MSGKQKIRSIVLLEEFYRCGRENFFSKQFSRLRLNIDVIESDTD